MPYAKIKVTDLNFFLNRRGSWRPIGHMRPSSPLLDSVRDLFEGHDQLAKDFTRAFHNTENQFNNQLFDITFIVGSGKEKIKLYGVRAILGVRSRYIYYLLNVNNINNIIKIGIIIYINIFKAIKYIIFCG